MYKKVVESVDYLKTKISSSPKIGIILGSGLGALVDSIENKVEIDYEDIPNFPLATVEGHGGKLIFGEINNKEVVCLSGRFHFYEGYTMKEVTFPVYVFKVLGVENIIVTNSCGGINTELSPGSLMIIDDFINLMGTNPLIGKNDERFGPRFPDMTEPYSYELINKAKEVADSLNIKYSEGVYAGFFGPYYETRAEIRMIGRMGADAVGMSTVPETIVANHLGMKVFGVSCITNMATGIQKMKHSHANVVDVANKASANLCTWIEAFIAKI